MSKISLSKARANAWWSLSVVLSLTACVTSEAPTVPQANNPSRSAPLTFLPSPSPPQPRVIEKPLPARSVRLRFRVDPALLRNFKLQQLSDVGPCQQALTAVQTLITIPGSLSAQAQANLTQAGVQIEEQGAQTLLTFSNTLQQLAQDTLGLDYTLNDLPEGVASGQTVFKDSQGGELGYVDYNISVSTQTGTSVTIQLTSTGEPAALSPCPKVAATVTGATLTATGGDISAATNPQSSPPPSGAAPVIASLSPLSAPVLSQVIITGSGLTGATAVEFAGIPAFEFSVDSDTQITATVPGGFTSGPIRVVTPAGSATSSQNFTLQAYTGPPRILYVKQTATPGNGSSWNHAMNRLDMALELAQAGDQIWVAEGVYKPTAGTDRSKSFRLKEGVSLYGGFAGYETSITQRNIDAHETQLSGDLAGNDNYTDADFSDVTENSYHVLIGANNATVDGFTIVGGNATGRPPDDRGGGILNLGTSPTLNRVRFLEDRAGYMGGGMYNASGAAPQLSNFSFNGCFAYHAGGAMYNAPGAAPQLSQGQIAYNSAKHGGGIFNERSSPVLNQVDFTSNTAQYFGGGMCNRSGASPILNGGEFLNNRGGIGGAIYNTDGASPTIRNYTFTVNKAESGAAIYAYNNSLPTIEQSVFKGNTATFFGGGIYLYKASAGIPTIERVVFVDNSARDGAGIAIRGASSPQIHNVLFANNAASVTGGAVYATSLANPVIRQATLYKNVANTTGADIFATISAQVSLFNSIIWNPSRPQSLKTANSAQISVTQSILSDLTGVMGPGNRREDPYFSNPVDLDGPDNVLMTADDGLRLADTSPALASGLEAGMPSLDILGATRTVPPDLGAYQGGVTPVLEPLLIEDLVEGTGPAVVPGNTVTVHYTGWLTDGTQFDSSYDRSQPFSFTVGAGQVIQGWEQGIPGMKVGGKRKLTVPPYLGYGASTVGIIPPNSTLIFEVELISIP